MEKGLLHIVNKAKGDPLFAAEGLDLENARITLQKLEGSIDEVSRPWKGMIPKLFFLKHQPRKSVHPVRFLSDFLESERIRREFLEEPTQDGADALLAQWDKTLQAYEEDAKAYKKALLDIQRIEGIDPSAAITYFNTGTTLNELLGWVDGLLENASAIESELKALRETLQNNRNDVVVGARGQREYKQWTENDLAPVDPGLKQLVGVHASLIKSKENLGTVVCEVDHFDEGNMRPHRFSVWKHKSIHSDCDLVTILLEDDMFFLNLAQGHFLDLSIYATVMDRGLDYWYQPATSLYSTLDVSYWAEVVTRADLEKREFENSSLVVGQQCSLLDLLLGAGVSANISFSKLIKIFDHNNTSTQLSFWYFARAYPTLYFLSFNESVWRLRKDPLLKGTRFGAASHYKPYKEVKGKVSLDVLKEVVSASTTRTADFMKKLGI